MENTESSVKDELTHLKKVVPEKPAKPKITKEKAQPRKLEDIKTDRDIALDFATKIQKRFDRMVKASILFGSQTKNTAGASSDIDIVLILDDASINWDLELIAWYREELGKLIAGEDHGKDLHINTVKLTTWWQDMMNGDPVVINILRYGEALIDYGGFFNPLKSLLLQGKIKSTPEAVYTYLERAPNHLARSRSATMNAIEGIYWAMMDAAQAALMMAQQAPPSPEDVPEMLTRTFVEKGMLKINYVRAIRDIYHLHKSIVHGEVSHIKGGEIDSWQETASNFVKEMTRIISSMIDKK